MILHVIILDMDGTLTAPRDERGNPSAVIARGYNPSASHDPDLVLGEGWIYTDRSGT